MLREHLHSLLIGLEILLADFPAVMHEISDRQDARHAQILDQVAAVHTGVQDAITNHNDKFTSTVTDELLESVGAFIVLLERSVKVFLMVSAFGPNMDSLYYACLACGQIIFSQQLFALLPPCKFSPAGAAMSGLNLQNYSQQ